MRKHVVINSSIVILTFLIAYYGGRVVSDIIPVSSSDVYLKIAIFYAWWLIPTVMVTGILFGFIHLANHIGIHKGFLKGLIFSIITVSPMLLSSAIIGEISDDLNMPELIRKTLFAGVMEEYLFRGFLFGLLFRKLGWGFIPSSLAGALIFGFGHVYQGSSFVESSGVFLVTALGAVWFAWLYIEWNSNLWIPIFLHTGMNLSWSLFDVSDNALGGWYSNLFRIITIALTIIITIKYNGKSGLRINRSNLLRHAGSL